MKILICGLGSIGQRHVRILKKLHKNNLELFTLKDSKRNLIITDSFKVQKVESVADFYNIKVIKINELRKHKIKIAYICTPPSSHINLAIQLARLDCNLFIEKPLSNNIKNIGNLLKIIRKKKLITHVGYQLQFHPAVKKISSIINKKILGKTLSSTFYFGEYPGNVRKYEKFTFSHMAKKKMGGGSLLALSHHLDLGIYFFGKLKIVNFFIKNSNNFKIDVEDIFRGVFTNKSKLDLQLNLNFLDAEQNNFLIFNFQKGTILWDYYNNYLKISYYKRKKNKILRFKNFYRNNMFENQSKLFLSNIKKKNFSLNSINNSVEVLKIIKKIKT